jgi:hypothetical protein
MNEALKTAALELAQATLDWVSFSEHLKNQGSEPSRQQGWDLHNLYNAMCDAQDAMHKAALAAAI